MASYTDRQKQQLRGQWPVKCVKVGGSTILGFYFAQNETRDLLDPLLPASIRAANYNTARNMTTDPVYPITQAIAAGDFVLQPPTAPLPPDEVGKPEGP